MAATGAREKRLAELKKEVTRRGFDRHASRLKHISELPIELQSPAVSALAARETIQTIIMFPAQIQRGWHYVPKQALLFTTTGLLHLLASIWPDQEPDVTCLEAADLMYVKIKLLLLYGFLEIAAQGQDAPIQLGMEFNTVDWYSLSLPLQQFLQASRATSGIAADEPAYSQTSKQAFEKLPLKFSNGLKIHGLLPGEELQDLAFQAAVWKRRLYFFRQPVLANTLLLLTSHYMVVIQEEVNIHQGWIISYIPREGIAAMRSQPCELWNELSVQLKRGNQAVDYKLMLRREALECWRGAWIQQGGQWQEVPGELV